MATTQRCTSAARSLPTSSTSHSVTRTPANTCSSNEPCSTCDGSMTFTAPGDRVLQAHESHVAVGNASLYVREIGQGHPVLVLHGGPDFDHSYLLPEMDRLAESH